MNLAKELNERIVREILSLDGIAQHPQANGVNAATVEPINEFQGRSVALLSQPNRLAEGVWFAWR
jgi:hypothetical protein